MIKKYFLIAIVFLFFGCASSYERNYKAITQIKFEPTSDVKIIDFKFDSEITEILEQGNAIIGYTSFYQEHIPSEKDLIEYGKSIGADKVLRSRLFLGQKTGTRSVSTYIPSQTYTAVSNNTQLKVTTQSYNVTNQVPYNYDEYYNFFFFTKNIDTSDLVFGVEYSKNENLEDGCKIGLVYKGTPSYQKLFEDDLIIKMNNVKISNCNDLKKLINTSKTANLELLRKNYLHRLTIILNMQK